MARSAVHPVGGVTPAGRARGTLVGGEQVLHTRAAGARHGERDVAGAALRGVPAAEALDAWLEACGDPRLGSERVPIVAALGRVTAAPVKALCSSPAFPAAAMDGIAVSAADTAGAGPDRPVGLGAARFDVVDTGDPLPAGRDAVIVREQVALEDDVAMVAAVASRGEHVRPVSEDVAAGEVLVGSGERLRPFDLALAAAGGVTEVMVRRRALVSIVPTGDEIRPVGATLAAGELLDTNSLMLEGQAREAGCETHRVTIVPDHPDRLASALRAAAEDSDLVILVAGTSAGRHDYAPEVLRRCGRVAVRGVAMRPGHPVVLGAVGAVPVMACPGYPVSAALAFDALAVPLLASLEQTAPAQRPTVAAQLASAVRSKPGRRELLRVRLGTVNGRRVAVPMRRGASVLSSLAYADALVALPSEAEGLGAGAPVEAELLRSRPGWTVLLAGAADPTLDLLALRGAGRVAFCEMAPAAALALLRDGGCHAAAFSGPLDDPDGRLVATPLAEVDIVLAAARDTPVRAIRAGVRVAVGPRGTPARRVLEAATPACEIVAARSDAAAFAAVAAGGADCAVGALDAARRAGMSTTPLGRAALSLVIRRDAVHSDPAVQALLDITNPHIKENATP
ncbi:MAG: molybdopterin molybdotransferase [Solirubrobacteraceae bacterium]|nr:molybdopterin molybdotransferase [Solirubrobacteraceae bacterium]